MLLIMIYSLMWPLPCLRPRPPDRASLSRPQPPVWGRFSWAANILIKNTTVTTWNLIDQVKLVLVVEWPPELVASVPSYLMKDHSLEVHWSPILYMISHLWSAGWWPWMVSLKETDWYWRPLHQDLLRTSSGEDSSITQDSFLHIIISFKECLTSCMEKRYPYITMNGQHSCSWLVSLESI